MAFAEMDHSFVRAIRYLHSSSNESQNNIRMLLNEAIKSKYGPENEIGPYVNLSTMFQEYPMISTGNTIGSIDALKDDLKDLGSSSDNELELDLLKEDLLCIVCKGMGVGRRNRLVECCDCHNLYHQECHDPTVSDEDTEASGWICATCKDVQASKAAKKPVQSPISNITSLHNGSRSPSNANQNNQILAPTKSYCEKESSEIGSTKLPGSKSSSSSSSSTSSKSSSAPNRVMTPNINLVSADKRLQIMKKKAAKLQEKRKLSR